MLCTRATQRDTETRAVARKRLRAYRARCAIFRAPRGINSIISAPGPRPRSMFIDDLPTINAMPHQTACATRRSLHSMLTEPQVSRRRKMEVQREFRHVYFAWIIFNAPTESAWTSGVFAARDSNLAPCAARRTYTSNWHASTSLCLEEYAVYVMFVSHNGFRICAILKFQNVFQNFLQFRNRTE